jgi:hypothetical protein
VEVFRLGIANNVVPVYTTLANRGVGNAAYEGLFAVPVTNVLGGDNVIAVEVHQNSLTSSDVEWAGEFSIDVPPVLSPVAVPGGCTNISFSAPTLRYQSSGTNIVLSWTNPVTNTCGGIAIYTLQQTLALSNAPAVTPWVNVTSVSPFTTPRTNVMRFFRLIKP